MAYNPITSNEVITGAPIDQNLLNKVKGNFDDHNAQISDIREQELWTNAIYQSGWSDYSYPSWPKASFYKDEMGVVRLRGMVKGPIGSIVFILPVGYRPSQVELFAAMASNAIARIDVRPDGSVYASVGSTTGWLSLSGISFRAEQ